MKKQYECIECRRPLNIGEDGSDLMRECENVRCLKCLTFMVYENMPKRQVTKPVIETTAKAVQNRSAIVFRLADSELSIPQQSRIMGLFSGVQKPTRVREVEDYQRTKLIQSACQKNEKDCQNDPDKIMFESFAGEDPNEVYLMQISEKREMLGPRLHEMFDARIEKVKLNLEAIKNIENFDYQRKPDDPFFDYEIVMPDSDGYKRRILDLVAKVCQNEDFGSFDAQLKKAENDYLDFYASDPLRWKENRQQFSPNKSKLSELGIISQIESAKLSLITNVLQNKLARQIVRFKKSYILSQRDFIWLHNQMTYTQRQILAEKMKNPDYLLLNKFQLERLGKLVVENGLESVFDLKICDISFQEKEAKIAFFSNEIDRIACHKSVSGLFIACLDFKKTKPAIDQNNDRHSNIIEHIWLTAQEYVCFALPNAEEEFGGLLGKFEHLFIPQSSTNMLAIEELKNATATWKEVLEAGNKSGMRV